MYLSLPVIHFSYLIYYSIYDENMASTRKFWLKHKCVPKRERVREVSPALCPRYHQSDGLEIYAKWILIYPSQNEGILYVHVSGSSIEHGLASVEYSCMYILACIHSQAMDYFNFKYSVLQDIGKIGNEGDGGGILGTTCFYKQLVNCNYFQMAS